MISEKKLNKIVKALGETAKELETLGEVALKEKIAHAASSIKQAEEELEANPSYQEIKENLKALTEGMKEVRKRQSAIIHYCLHILEGAGRE